MNQLTAANEQALVFENNGKVVTDSLMIAEMFEKTHDNVLKDIRKQIEYAGPEFSLVNFHESNYENECGRKYLKYNLTEEAFTLVAMSYNTKEAVQMKIKFIEEFKRMKQHIQNQQQLPKDPMSILKLTFDVLDGQKQEIQDIKSDVKDLRENAPLYAIECDEVSKVVRKLGVLLLGGKESNAYRDVSLRKKVYSDIYSQLHREFGISSYKAIKRHHLDRAIQIINEEYSLPIILEEEITATNAQINMAEVQ
ncbi:MULTISPECIES: Rha family transcriptional regulator [Bacillus cereus group]|uniref:Rha family transcriptional regulator n=1 Tax=Bacillus cereus group TaxID=86661 RepID=UPI0022E91AE0|nr:MULTISPECIES: ORF6C domain-containing protein [unclassified Bacillus cereus group]MDA2665158.1 ORF6C domain-containing protein [Bacillus cereus group sp. Bc032]MDA2675913.1 ORF6C domain-containing protein [Bacillus cereus group sp. Bc031]MDA2681396.1 ORF6C domain-containing protein [Bacillus cereus group sp. Bc029]MDA2686852.1 ORF6C domain-containing protein [Bacillus cereus group sp. Bc030]MDA2742372.1 ORF6C domain-containing protein [Bacillus cereus group sp. Bc011]